MIKFDLSDFEGNDLVEEAIVSLYINGFSDAASCSLHTLSKNFDVNEVTWDFAKSGLPWEKDEETSLIGQNGEVIYGGGEYDPSLVVGNPGATSLGGAWESYDVTSIVKDILSGNADNNGFVLKTFYNNSILKEYHSTEAENAEDRPKLELKFKSTGISFGKSRLLSNVVKMSQSNNVVSLLFNKNGNYNISVVNLSGRSVKNVSVSNGKALDLNTESFAKGVYLINVSADDVNLTRNFIIK